MYEFGFKGGDQSWRCKNINLSDSTLMIIFKAMELDEIPKREGIDREDKGAKHRSWAKPTLGGSAENSKEERTV